MNKLVKLNSFKLLIVVIILLSLYIATEPVWDNDLWWHLETGRYMVESTTVPTTDIFSFYGLENDFKWIAHEWLSDVILYKVYAIGGYQGLILFPPFMLLLTLLILYQANKERIKDNYLLGSLCFFSTGFILAAFSATRPHMFSFLLFALTILVLNKFLYEGSKKIIWFIPLITLLWVNLHGGSSALIFVMIFFAIIFNSAKFSLGRLEGQKHLLSKTRTLFFVLLASLGAGLINPYSYRILLYPFENMADSTMLSAIVEWHSPNFHNPEGIIVFIILSIVIVLTLISDKKISLYQLAILGAYAFLSLKSIRQISYFAIATLPIALYHMPKLDYKRAEKTNPKINLIVVLLVFALFTFNVFNTFSEPVKHDNYPIEAINTIKEYQPQRLLNHYNWGGFLIYELYDEDIHPFIDGRADIFSKTIMDDYNNIHFLCDGWEKSFDKYNFDAVLFPTNNLLIRLLLQTGEWDIAYQDGFSTFLVRR